MCCMSCVACDVWHVMCCMSCVACHVLHVICIRFHPGHLGIHVGDSSRRSKEIVKIFALFNAIITIITMLINMAH